VSVCTFNDEYLLAAGGIDSKNNTVRSIFRLNLEDPHTCLWETLDVKLTVPLSNVGLFQVKPDKLLVFGGWNDSGTKQVVHLLTEKPNGKYSLQTKRNKSGDLKNADSFMMNGVVSENQEKQEITFAGTDYMHKFNYSSHTFATLRKLQW